MKILDLYKAVLEASGASIDDDGLVSMTRPGEDPIPFMVTEKRLALPTAKLLNAGAFNPEGNLIAFHPICENVVLDTSPVLQKLETAMTFRLTWVMRELIMQLVTVAANPKLHKKMKVREHGLLSAMPDADEKTRDLLLKVMENTTTVGQKKLLTLYVRKGGTFGGEKVSRLARFFPSIVDALDQDKRTLLGTQLRKADIPQFLALIEYLLPEYRDSDRYASPSNASVAPTFHALVKTYAKVANQFNKIIDTHANQLQNPDQLKIDTSWVDDVQDLSNYREQIPVLPGNDGAEGTRTAKPAKVAPATTATSTATPAPSWQKPTTQTHSTPTKTAGKMSVDDLIKGLTPPRGQYGSFQSNRAVQQGWGGQQVQNNTADLPPWARPTQASWNTPAPGGFQRGGTGGTGSL